MNNIKQEILRLSQELFDKVKGYREHLHAHPELSYEEFATMEYVSEKLTELGIQHEKGFGKTGVVALIPSPLASDSCIALRSDLDALPIHEENDVPYRSQKPGVMHACGHDVHTAILLGVAEIIHSNRHYLKQTVKLIFQPGEEKNPGGATLMIEDGVLANPKVERMYALHVFPDMVSGEVGFRKGLYMASCDEIHLTIHGRGGHGALPEKCIDPISIGALIVTNLQQVISRHGDPKIPSVLSIGHFEAIGATNIIPDKAILKGTFRTMNEAWRTKAHQLIENIIDTTCTAHGAKFELNLSKGYPCLINDSDTTDLLQEKAKIILGNSSVHELDIRMTSEDFAFYSQHVPVCFFRLGVRNEQAGIVYNVHHPKFNIEPTSLITGMQILAASCFDL